MGSEASGRRRSLIRADRFIRLAEDQVQERGIFRSAMIETSRSTVQHKRWIFQ